jgi:stage II sporulation protein D
MTKGAAILGLALLLPCAAKAQTVQVEAFALRPPSRVSLTSVDGQLRWRYCATCPEGSGPSLAIDSFGNGIRLSAGSLLSELTLKGHYRLSGDSIPTIVSSNAITIRSRDSHLLIVFSMPLEDYVGTVLAAEGGDLRGNEARKAMAVAIRSYALRFNSRHAAEGFDFCDTTHCQAVRWGPPDARAQAAAAATRDEILLFAGSPAATYYHQNCGGTVAAAKEVWPDSGQPYLPRHADPYCVTGEPLHWESTVSVADLDKALRASGLNPPHGWSVVEIVQRSESGRAQILRLAGGPSARARVSASSFRYAVGRALGWNKIRSDLYDVHTGPNGIVFSGRGSGHGVGLCQAGAEQMDLQGKDYREILGFYFPGTQLTKTTKAAWQRRLSERFELDSTAPDQDAFVLPIAARILKQDEDIAGLIPPSRVRLQVFATLDAFRDATGEPGWIAASTRGDTIRLQPLAQLRVRSILESTLRHELFHVLVESKASAATPLWFREGLVLYFTGEIQGSGTTEPMTAANMETILQQPRSREEMERAYVAAYATVARLIERNGRATVIDWLGHGLPAGLNGSL